MDIKIVSFIFYALPPFIIEKHVSVKAAYGQTLDPYHLDLKVSHLQQELRLEPLGKFLSYP